MAQPLPLSIYRRHPFPRPFMSSRPKFFQVDKGHSHDESNDEDAENIRDLNRSLHILATIFPNISPEVFREGLQAFSGESRLQLVVDQLLKNQDEWVRGRWRPPTETRSYKHESTNDQFVRADQEFRRASYKWAVYAVLCQEFKSVNKSAIRAVLAEENHDYSRARETLQKLAAKSWRNTISSLWNKWRRLPEEQKTHFMITWNPNGKDSLPPQLPTLRETGDVELDDELRQTILAPLIATIHDERDTKDRELAIKINEQEAKAAAALYECQCCFADTTFEQIAACTGSSHFVCYRCVHRSVTEALFGQGWSQHVDHSRGAIKCPSIAMDEECSGCIPQQVTKEIIQQNKGGLETWKQFESRLADEGLSQAGVHLVKCPFCPYAEIDEVYIPPAILKYKANISQPKHAIFLFILTLNFLPVILLYTILSHLRPSQTLPPLTHLLSTAHSHLIRKHHRPQRFHCRSPTCNLQSCLTCTKLWRDPHTCHESAASSLRAAIESAQTAALKRTCPRCNLAFIKDSGCNKLTCTCGYSMCYVCRQGLGKGEGGEGYRHFCQHFRPMGGVCHECEKCDLYKNADDDDVVLNAGIRAEKEWREREGMVGVAGIGGSQSGSVGEMWTWDGWTLQGFVDWWLACLVTC